MNSGPYIRLILAKTSKEIERVDRSSIANSGLNISDFGILEALMHKGALPVNTIGKKVLLTSGSMTVAANRLIEKGLIERRQDQSDKRVFNLDLTVAGRGLIEKAYEKHACNLDRIFDVLTSRERKQIVTLMNKIGRYAQRLDFN